jgi:hypothetical protein
VNDILQLAQLVLAAQNKTALPPFDATAWDALAAQADTQRLSGYLFARLQNHPQRAEIPSHLFQAWRAYYMRQWAKNTRLLAEMTRLQSQWRGEMVFFKGPLLAQRLYGALDARAISDLDILLPTRDAFADADAQLRALGYTRVSRTLFTPRVSQRLTYHFEYHRGDLPLELHWNVQQHPSFTLDLRALWERRARAALDNNTFETLALQDELLVALLAIPIDLQLNKLTLRALFEIFLLLLKMGETFAWQNWLAERARDGTLRVTRQTFAAVAQLFGAQPLPHAVQTQIENTSAQNSVLENFTPLSAWQRRRAAFALYESSAFASLLWWAFSLGGRMLAHPTETRKTLRRLRLS